MNHHTPRVYPDASVYAGAVDEEYRRASRVFLDQARAGMFRLLLSPLVEEEMLLAPQNARVLYESMAEGGEMLSLTEQTLRLQEAYVEAGIVEPRWASEALHVAHASTHGCALLVTWNCRHIAHYKKAALYNAVNLAEGHGAIGIHTPLEVVDYEGL